MKKSFMLLLVTLGFTGLVSAQTDNMWVSPQPLKDYSFNNNAFKSSDFFDLNNAYTKEINGEIILSDEATAYGIEELTPLGEGLADGAALNDVFFGYDESTDEWKTVTRSGADSKATAYPVTDITFMEKAVTGFVLSAAGGIFLTDETGNLEMALPAPLTDVTDLSAKYALRAYTAHVTYPDGNPIKSAVTIKKIADLPVGILTAGKDPFTQNAYYLVQYNYLLNADTLIYQIKFMDNGLVECKIGKQNKLKSGSDDDLYNLCLDMKREANTLEFGGNSIYTISKGLAGWQCNTSQSLQNRCLSICPKGGTINGIPHYTSIDATVVLSEKSQETLSNVSSLLVFATPQNSVNPKFANKAYAVGDYVENANNFLSPGYRVVYNAKPSNLNDIAFAVNGLTPNEKYYLYAYLCKEEDNNYSYAAEALVSSDGIKTSPMETPANVTVSAPEDDHMTLHFDATVFKTLVVKSGYAASNEPSGTLSVGDKLAYGTVTAILEKGATDCDIEMTPGEMTYIQMYAIDDNAATPGYSTNFTLMPLYRQATALPLGYTFGEHDFIDQQPEGAMPILPPGMGTSTTDVKLADYAFYAFPPLFFGREDVYLTSLLNDNATEWPNVIFPAFSGAVLVQATFNVRFYERALQDFATTDASGVTVRIEYSLNDGNWREAGVFNGDNFPQDIAGLYPLNVSFTCAPSDIVKVRYSYNAKRSTQFENAIVSYEFVDASNCEMPTNLKVVAGKTTDKAVTLTWKDNNAPAAGQYRVLYQKYVAPVADNEDDDDLLTLAENGDEADVWESQTVNATKATLRNLESNTAYNIKVQAVCTGGESFPSPQVQVSIPAGMPYVEDMTFADFDRISNDYAVKPAVTVYKGEPGIEEEVSYLTPMGEDASSWDAIQSATGVTGNDPDALAVSTAQDEALLATPEIFIHPYVSPLPKTLTFRVNTFAMDEDGNVTDGVDLKDEELRLYVLVSTNGTFSWNDTVKAFDHHALKATAAANTEDRGMDLSVDMTQYEGLVRIAFYFHNPNTFQAQSEDDMPMFLEILGISLNFDGGVPCWPVEELKATNVDVTEATLTWEGEGEEYGITYYPTTDKTQAKTVYQDATDADLQTLKLEGLTTNVNYTAEVVSYCTKGDRQNGSIAVSTRFRTLRELYTLTLNVLPDGTAGTVTGNGSYLEGGNVTLTATPAEGYKFAAWKDGDSVLSNDTVYKFKMPARSIVYTAVFTTLEKFTVSVDITPKGAGRVTGTGRHTEGEEVKLTATPNQGYKFVVWKEGETELSNNAVYTFTMPSEHITYTAVFEPTTANEDPVRANFNVFTDHGQLMVRNLNGLTVKDIEVYGLAGNRIHRFAPNSREDLTLPVDATHALIFVRLNTEKGAAIYKVYMH